MEEKTDHTKDGRSTCDLNLVERLYFGRPRHRWEDNNKNDLKERGRRAVAWFDLTHKEDRWRAFINTVMNLQVSQNAAHIVTSREIPVFSRRVPWKQSVAQLVSQLVK
jgi:hypothetical protein